MATGFLAFSRSTAPRKVSGRVPNLWRTRSIAGAGPDIPRPLTTVSLLPWVTTNLSLPSPLSTYGVTVTPGTTSIQPSEWSRSAFGRFSSDSPTWPTNKPLFPS